MVDLALGVAVAWIIVLTPIAMAIYLCLQARALIRLAERGGEL